MLKKMKKIKDKICNSQLLPLWGGLGWGLLFFFFPFSSIAQNIKATATLDSNSISIGQQIKLKLSVEYTVNNGKQIKLKWPKNADTIRKEIEIVQQSKVDTIIPDSSDMFRFIQTKTLFITSFNSGYWAIPPFKFIVNNDTAGIFTEPLLLQVNTIPVDTTLAIKDIKAPYDEEYTWLDWLKDNPFIVYGTLAGIILLILIIYFIRKHYKAKPVVVEVAAPKIPAHVIALEKLEKLQNEKLWQEGKLKLYHITLSEIVRQYIEDRFSIQALEQTTDEILFGFRNTAIDEESKTKLKQLLILSDLVKFAKEQPLPNENEQSLTNAFDFVNGTKKGD
jgi:hypothetical protein